MILRKQIAGKTAVVQGFGYRRGGNTWLYTNSCIRRHIIQSCGAVAWLDFNHGTELLGWVRSTLRR